MAGLENQPGPARVGGRLAADDDAHMARAPDGVDPLVGIARVNVDFFFLLIPRVQRVPLKSEMIFERRRGRQRLAIAPGRVLGGFLPRAERPPGLRTTVTA